MTTIVSYNILTGGYSMRENGAPRTRQLLSILRSAHPDIVGLIEATRPQAAHKPLVIEELAEELGMQLIRGGHSRHVDDYQTALLTRLPVVYTRPHSHPDLRRALLEVCVQDANGQQFALFVTHLSAAFNQGRAGGGIRQREVRAILHLLNSFRTQNIPHVLMGDFNSLAPGDRFQASKLVAYILQMDRQKRDRALNDGHPQLQTVVPPALSFLLPLLRLIPRSRIISMLFNLAASLYAPRSCIHLLREAGYTDCYRRIHPQALGFTCASAAPAGRIDFIFASPTMAERLETSYVLLEGEGVQGSKASDHLAVAAEFAPHVQTPAKHEALAQSLG